MKSYRLVDVCDRFGISERLKVQEKDDEDCLYTSSFVHTNLRWIIFDEADRILELGFGKEIEEILDFLGSRQHGSAAKNGTVMSKFEFPRQNLLLSATLNEKTSSSIDIEICKRCVPINFLFPFFFLCRGVPCNARLGVLLSILKYLFELETSEKVACFSTFHFLMSSTSFCYALPCRFTHMLILQIVLFFSTCDAVDFHYSLLNEFQFKPYSGPGAEIKQRFVNCTTFQLHANMEQEDRRSAFETFRREKSALLLSTDVCARGLDFPKVKCIIQYDSPGEATEYAHRVGRTARLGERGDSLLFLQPIEMDYLKELEKHGVSLAEFPFLKILDSYPLYGHKHVKKFVSIDAHP
ncbi:unnamed protein product [Malus baccata var. baccata]